MGTKSEGSFLSSRPACARWHVFGEVGAEAGGSSSALPLSRFLRTLSKALSSLQGCRHDQEIKDKILSCNILGWLGQRKV